MKAVAQDNFASCLKFVLKYEGGKVDHPRDPGGRTNQGVTQRTYDGWRTRQGLPQRDVYLISPEERDAIYRRDYWDKIEGDKLRPGEDLAVFDLAVNSGVKRARNMHKSVRQAGDPATVVKDLCAARMAFLRRLKIWKTFGTGWSRRVAACEASGFRMAGDFLDQCGQRQEDRSQ